MPTATAPNGFPNTMELVILISRLECSVAVGVARSQLFELMNLK